MNAATISTVVIAVLALLAATGGTIAWFYKRGGDERTLTDAVHANTTATDKLTESMALIGNTLHDHEYRIKALEGVSK